jgi:hypothetical protein
MSSKVYNSAKEALEGLTFDGMTVMAGGFGLCGIPENLILALRESGVKDITALQQCGRRRFRPRPAAADAPDQEDDLVLCRREQGVHAPVSVRRAGAGVQPAGHAGRAHARRAARAFRASTPRPASARHRRGQGAQGFRRRDLHPGKGIFADLSIVKAVEGRHAPATRLPQDGAQLQPARGHVRQGLRDGSGRNRADRRSTPTKSTCPASTCTA